MATTRRLAAILAADVAGYSRLMGANEEGTHERLQTHLAELVHPKITEYRGRVVKNTGDGFLAEFGSSGAAQVVAGQQPPTIHLDPNCTAGPDGEGRHGATPRCSGHRREIGSSAPLADLPIRVIPV
jgi:class 3 adenylate cyclase